MITGLEEPRPPAELLTVTSHPASPEAMVIAARGEVDLLTSSLLRDGLLTHLRHTGPHLIADLTKVDFFGGAGLTALVTAREAAAATGVTLCVIADTRPVLIPLTITGLDRVFDTCPDLAHALRRLGNGANVSGGG